MEVKQAIDRRRAYRSLDPVEITPELVQDLAECARLVPSRFNNQPWRFVFVYDPERLREMRTALNQGNEWAWAASLIVAGFSKKELDCQIKGRDYYFPYKMLRPYSPMRCQAEEMAAPIRLLSPWSGQAGPA